MLSIDPVSLLTELLKISSLSRDEADAVTFLVNQMSDLGYQASVDDAGNAVGIRELPNEQNAIEREIVLLGHIDTVPGSIAVRIEDGALYGRGSVDAKGPLATFVMAASKAILRPGTRIVVVGAVEEEAATSKGARFITSKYQPAFCIIGEPSGWDAVTLGYKGRILFDYSLQAPMAHTAGPDRNIAEQAIDWWNAIKSSALQHNSELHRLFDYILPSLRSFNTDSDGLTRSVYATIGVRLPPDIDIEAYKTFVHECAGDAELRSYAYEPAFQSSRQTDLTRAFSSVFYKEKIKPRYKVKTGTSDMNVVAPIWNCPILAYGPGNSRLDHTPNEHITVADYLRAIEILSQVLEIL